MRRYIMSGACNMRDLGGHPTRTGTATKFGAFIRSDAPENITEEEMLFLCDTIGVATVIDMRGSRETSRTPPVFQDVVGIQYFNRYLHDHWEEIRSEDDFPVSYMSITREKSAMFDIFKIIAAAKKSVLFHCHAGKDRTGVVSAILLLLGGVLEPDIIADYCISEVYRSEPNRDRREKNPFLPDYYGTSKPEYMETFLRRFMKTHGSAHDYLLGIGLTEGEILTIKTKLV